MDEQKIVITATAYSNYLEAVLKLQLLKDMLETTPDYNWPHIVRKVLGMEEKE